MTIEDERILIEKFNGPVGLTEPVVCCMQTRPIRVQAYTQRAWLRFARILKDLISYILPILFVYFIAFIYKIRSKIVRKVLGLLRWRRSKIGMKHNMLEFVEPKGQSERTVLGRTKVLSRKPGLSHPDCQVCKFTIF